MERPPSCAWEVSPAWDVIPPASALGFPGADLPLLGRVMGLKAHEEGVPFFKTHFDNRFPSAVR